MRGELLEESTVATLAIHLTEIPDEGLDITEEVQPDELELTTEEAVLREPISLSVNLIKAGAHVHAEGAMEGTFIWECVRCLKPYDKAMHIPFIAEYRVPDSSTKSRGRVMKDRRQDSSDVESVDQDDDAYVCTGDQVELADMLREHIILSVPMQPLCHEQCRGLCPVCGRDRNEELCSCVEETQKNPFAILQERLKHRNS